MAYSYTPAPWTTDVVGHEISCIEREVVIATMSPNGINDDSLIAQRKTNADFIVMAVNAHEKLVVFIESITDALGKYPELDGTRIVSDARRVLAESGARRG